MAASSNDLARIEALITRLLTELIDAQELTASGRVRDLMRIADLRARLFGLRSEHALLGKEPNPALAVTYADRERRFMHEARQIAKQVIADELEELRAYVLEGTELEEQATALPEKRPCAPDPSGTASASSPGSDLRSKAASSTSP